jgi:hypothetical protein
MTPESFLKSTPTPNCPWRLAELATFWGFLGSQRSANADAIAPETWVDAQKNGITYSPAFVVATDSQRPTLRFLNPVDIDRGTGNRRPV